MTTDRDSLVKRLQEARKVVSIRDVLTIDDAIAALSQPAAQHELEQIHEICLNIADCPPVIESDTRTVRYLKDMAHLINKLSTPAGEQEAVANEVKVLRQSLDFYQRRCVLLQKWQSQMRDPERTIVCDILANGCTLNPPSDRYTTPPDTRRLVLEEATKDRARLDKALTEAYGNTTPAPGIDEQIAFIESFNKHDESVGYTGRSYDIRTAILATLRKYKAITEAPKPEPVARKDMLRLRNGFFVRADGSEEPTYGHYVTEADYDKLLAAYERMRVERDHWEADHTHVAGLLQTAESQRDALVRLMREPDEEMLAEGYCPQGETGQSWGVDDIWKAMSAVALRKVGVEEKK